MATLTEWSLPLNRPSPYPFYLHFLTEPRKGRLYYTKHTLDIVGALTVSKSTSNVREWVIPRALFGKASSGGAYGITYGPADRVWFALQNAHRLVELDPGTGSFTAFGGTQYPIRYPRHLMFDGGDNLWYTGAGTNGALIGRLNRSRTRATYWDLPAEMAVPEGLWVDRGGEAIWFTPINANLYQTGAFLGRLVPGANELTYWTYPGAGLRPINAGVVGDEPTHPANIWFTYQGSGPHSRVFRFHLGSNTFFQYAPTFSAPRRVVVDASKNAWISDWSGKVSRVEYDDDCGTIRLTPDRLRVETFDRAVKSQQATARATVHSVAPTSRRVQPVKDNCYAHYPLPSPLTSHGIQIDPARRKPHLYFTQGSGGVIGRLTQ